MSREKLPPKLEFRRQADGLLTIELGGDWTAPSGLPATGSFAKELDATPVKAIEFDSTALGRWNSRLMSLVLKFHEVCRQRQIEFRAEGLPAGIT